MPALGWLLNLDFAGGTAVVTVVVVPSYCFTSEARSVTDTADARPLLDTADATNRMNQ